MNNKKPKNVKNTIIEKTIIEKTIIEKTIIEDKCASDFLFIMNDLKTIGKQVSTIKEKVDELKKDRLFTRKQQMRILR